MSEPLAGLREQINALALTAHQVREQGDVRQVVLGEDGVAEGPSLADELWTIAYNARVLLDEAERLVTEAAGAGDAERCHRCGGANVIWSAASPLWNFVMRGNDINGDPRHGDLVCMPCFIVCAVEAGLPAVGWRLTLAPEPSGLVYETPSGRRWDAPRFLWVDADEVDESAPCGEEMWSLDHFKHQQVDGYWMACHRAGKHDEHENSETGATWTGKDR